MPQNSVQIKINSESYFFQCARLPKSFLTESTLLFSSPLHSNVCGMSGKPNRTYLALTEQDEQRRPDPSDDAESRHREHPEQHTWTWLRLSTLGSLPAGKKASRTFILGKTFRFYRTFGFPIGDQVHCAAVRTCMDCMCGIFCGRTHSYVLFTQNNAKISSLLVSCQGCGFVYTNKNSCCVWTACIADALLLHVYEYMRNFLHCALHFSCTNVKFIILSQLQYHLSASKHILNTDNP